MNIQRTPGASFGGKGAVKTMETNESYSMFSARRHNDMTTNTNPSMESLGSERRSKEMTT